ncbi:MAG: DUF2934 domain-containing protein [Proteobacteria bacterium]|nr:DUF2934 domain-containing protein [Pseudomonadota bacterium]
MGKQTIHTRVKKPRGASASAAPAMISKRLVRKVAEEADVAASGANPVAAAPEMPEERRARIAESAYFRAERRGFAVGHELEDWLAAEQDIERALPERSASNIESG